MLKSKANAKVPARGYGDGVDGDSEIGPPFTIQHKWKPVCCARAHLCGTVDGLPTRFITNVSCRMSQDFLKIASTLLEEANDGAFLTKRQAIDRRDKLVYTG